jgi:hypothetical protein
MQIPTWAYYLVAGWALLLVLSLWYARVNRRRRVAEFKEVFEAHGFQFSVVSENPYIATGARDGIEMQVGRWRPGRGAWRWTRVHLSGGQAAPESTVRSRRFEARVREERKPHTRTVPVRRDVDLHYVVFGDGDEAGVFWAEDERARALLELKDIGARICVDEIVVEPGVFSLLLRGANPEPRVVDVALRLGLLALDRR